MFEDSTGDTDGGLKISGMVWIEKALNKYLTIDFSAVQDCSEGGKSRHG